MQCTYCSVFGKKWVLKPKTSLCTYLTVVIPIAKVPYKKQGYTLLQKYIDLPMNYMCNQTVTAVEVEALLSQATYNKLQPFDQRISTRTDTNIFLWDSCIFFC